MKTRMLAVVVAMLGAQSMALANDWTELRSDAAGTSFSPEVSGTSFAPAWTYKAAHGGRILSTPVSVDGVVVTASTGGDIAALGLFDGAQKWARVLNGPVGSTPAVSKGLIAISTLAGQLYGLHLDTGEIGWQQGFGGGMNYASPVVVDEDGSIVLAEGFPAQNISRFDLATGKRVWTAGPPDVADLLYTTPAIAGQQVIFGMNGGRYQSLDLGTSATRWKFDAIGGQVLLSSPLVDGKTVYMFPSDTNSQVFAVNADTGAPVAGFPVAIPEIDPIVSTGRIGRGPAVSSPMKAGGLVIVQLRRQDNFINAAGAKRVSMREYVAGIDPSTAKVAWQYRLANVEGWSNNDIPELNLCATPAGFASNGGALIAVSSSISPRVAVLDAATGTEQWTAELSAPGRSSPVFSNGQLLVGTEAGVLHAFASTVNKAPATPNGIVAAADTTVGGLAVHWNAASDPEGAPLAYRVRAVELGASGATIVVDSAPGQTSLVLPTKASADYDVSVRSIDPSGALSAWSPCSRGRSGSPGSIAMAPPPPQPMGPPPGPMAPPPPASTEPPCVPGAPAPMTAPQESPPMPASTTSNGNAPSAPSSAPVVTILASDDNDSNDSSVAVRRDSAKAHEKTTDETLGAMVGLPAMMIASPHSMAPSATTSSSDTPSQNGPITPAELAAQGGCSIGSTGRSGQGASMATLLLALVAFAGRARRRGHSAR